VRKSILALGLASAGLLIAHLASAQVPPPAAAPSTPVVDPVAATCQPLAEAECSTNTTCVWLPGYKVANGTEVPGYCRAAPKPLTARRPPVTAPTTSNP
jgi:hypothetical protein